MNMICAHCNGGIDDDSYYCDQCGKEILICPKCRKPGKGKICTSDGSTLLSMRNVNGNQTPSFSEVELRVSDDKLSTPNKSVLHLVNKNLGLDLTPKEGDILGRTTGPFANIFSKYPQISGKHLQISFDKQKGWHVKDLDSTNGTKYNKVKLRPLRPQVLSDKTFLYIANIEFYVQIVDQTKTGKTGTVRL